MIIHKRFALVKQLTLGSIAIHHNFAFNYFLGNSPAEYFIPYDTVRRNEIGDRQGKSPSLKKLKHHAQRIGNDYELRLGILRGEIRVPEAGGRGNGNRKDRKKQSCLKHS